MTDYDRHNAEIERLTNENTVLRGRIEIMEYALIVAATTAPRNICTAWQGWINSDFIKYFLDEAKKLSNRYAKEMKKCYWPEVGE